MIEAAEMAGLFRMDVPPRYKFGYVGGTGNSQWGASEWGTEALMVKVFPTRAVRLRELGVATSLSYPGSRAIRPEDGITPHAGIDLGGVSDSSVVAAMNDSSAQLQWDEGGVFGLVAQNDFDIAGQQYQNRLSHLEVGATVQNFISAFATEGVNLDGSTLEGLPAGIAIGNVGNTGYSDGAHLDWRTYEGQASGGLSNVSPLDSMVYGDYLNNQVASTAYAEQLSNLPYNSMASAGIDIWNRLYDYSVEVGNFDLMNGYIEQQAQWFPDERILR